MMTGPLITSIFNVNSVKKLSSSVNYFLLNELIFLRTVASLCSEKAKN